jgi:hypothetical protein
LPSEKNLKKKIETRNVPSTAAAPRIRKRAASIFSDEDVQPSEKRRKKMKTVRKWIEEHIILALVDIVISYAPKFCDRCQRMHASDPCFRCLGVMGPDYYIATAGKIVCAETAANSPVIAVAKKLQTLRPVKTRFPDLDLCWEIVDVANVGNPPFGMLSWSWDTQLKCHCSRIAGTKKYQLSAMWSGGDFLSGLLQHLD